MANLKQCITLLALSIGITAALLAPYMETLAYANYSNTISATLTVSGTCTVILSNTVVNFGSVQISGNAPTSSAVNDKNNGNNAANILLDGTNWLGTNTNTFFVSNTIWDFSSNTFTVSGNTLGLATGNLVDTGVVINPALGQDLFFGTQVPAQQNADTYSQTITIENLC